jgi:molybdenum cofactor cytidylyltransferase
MSRHGIIILAAGGSSRMGQPKQLLQFGGRTLLAHAVASARAVGCRPIVVVLGSGAGQMLAELSGTGATAVVNDRWERGIGSSIRLGVQTIMREVPDLDGALICLADQPLVGPASLNLLLESASITAKPICAAAYGGTVGTPCFFARSILDELLALGDGEGGKTVIRRDPTRVCPVPLPEAQTDVDTPEEYRRLAAPDDAAGSENDQ